MYAVVDLSVRGGAAPDERANRLLPSLPAAGAADAPKVDCTSSQLANVTEESSNLSHRPRETSLM